MPGSASFWAACVLPLTPSSLDLQLWQPETTNRKEHSMYCRKCGTQNEDNAYQCVKCGEVLQQPQPGSAAPPPAQPIPNYLAQAILVTVFCCLPFGIPAIVFAAQVNG